MKNRELIIIVGAGLFQLKAIAEAKALGFLVLCVDRDENAPGRQQCDFFEQISTKDHEKIIVCAQHYAKRFTLRGIMTAGTDVAYTVACVAQALKLPGIAPENVLKATDKFRMRTALLQKGVRVPLFQVKTIDEALDAATELGFPVVIKPVDNMGARGVRRIDTMQELQEQFGISLSYSGNYVKSAVIIEEFMEGPEISMDTLVENGTVHLITVADRHIDNLPYFIEKGHSIPSLLSDVELADAFDTMKQAIQAVGITHGAAKADIKITNEGAKIGEITARLSGGFHSQFTEYLATGMNSTRAAVQLAVNMPMDVSLITPHWNQVAIERAVIGEPGRIEKILGYDEACAVPGIAHIIFNLKEGDQVFPLKSNLGKVANIIAYGDSRIEAEAAVAKALECLTIQMKDEYLLTPEIA